MATQFTQSLIEGAADPDAVAHWSEHLPDNYVTCRDMRHTWRPYTAKPIDGGYERVLRCARCGTRRVQELDMRGHVRRGHYVYPDGYQAPPGTGRMDSDALRLESTLRYMTKTTTKGK
jgi:hypothetical protein